MPTAGSIRAGKAHVEIGADDAPLQRSLKYAAARLKVWGVSIQAVGARMATAFGGVLGGMAGGAKLFASIGDPIAKAAKRAGMAVEPFSKIAYAAERADVPLHALSNAIYKMQRDAGSGALANTMAEMGMAIAGFEQMSPEAQFLAIADAISAIDDQSARAAATMKIFGRAGLTLLPLWQADLRGDMARADLSGAQWSAQDAANAELFSDRIADLWAAIKRTLAEIGHQGFKQLIANMDTLLAYLRDMREWLRSNGEWVGRLVAAFASLTAAGLIIKGIGMGLSTIGTVLSTLAAMLPVLLNPWVGGFAIAASVITLVASQLVDLKQVFGGVIKALLNGDFTKAWDIISTAAALAFERIKLVAKEAMQSVWLSIKHSIANAILDLTTFPSLVWGDITHDGGAAQRAYEQQAMALAEDQRHELQQRVDRSRERELQQQLDRLTAATETQIAEEPRVKTPTWRPNFAKLAAAGGGELTAEVLGTFSARAAAVMAQQRERPIVAAIEKSNALLQDIRDELETDEGPVFE